jgi:hypothetical protein
MYEATHDLRAERPREQLEEMIRSLSRAEQVRLMALIWIRQGAYRPNEWQRAIRDANAADGERTAEHLIGLPPANRTIGQ